MWQAYLSCGISGFDVLRYVMDFIASILDIILPVLDSRRILLIPTSMQPGF